jgi:uncharacterized membrane protein YozB (DUF420 family)
MRTIDLHHVDGPYRIAQSARGSVGAGASISAPSAGREQGDGVSISAEAIGQVSPPSSARWAEKRSGDWFYAGMAVACLLVSLAAFGPSVMDPIHRLGSSTWIIAAHAGLFFLWLAVFLAQTVLIKRGAYKTHRRVGVVSAVLAVVMVPIGYMTAIEMTRRGFDFSGDLDLKHDPLGPIGQLIFPLTDIVEFAILVAVGYVFRHIGHYHKRLMLFATVALLPAPFAHFIGHNATLRTHGAVVLVPIFLSLAASGVYDIIAFRRIHPISLWLGIGIFLFDNLCATVIGHSPLWLHFARGLLG